MSDDFDTLVAQGKSTYGDLVARSWEILVARTDATNPAAIEATCDLQRNLVVAGAEWIALCERVLALAATPESAMSVTIPARTTRGESSPIQANESVPVATRHERAPRPRADASTQSSLPQPESNGVARKPASAPLNGQTAYRIFPLILDSAPSHVQLVAMSFNGADWHPIAAWRRIYQQVIQSLQRSDPDRFDTLAQSLTMSNGKPLFSRDRSVYMAPIDAGGGWFATGQMPTELILQRLRMLVDWWGLPREALSVEVMPEAPAPTASRPDDAQPVVTSGDTLHTASEPELEPSTGARAEDVTTLSEEAPAASLADVEPADADALPESDLSAPVVDRATPVLEAVPAAELASMMATPQAENVASDGSDGGATEDTELASMMATPEAELVAAPVAELPAAEPVADVVAEPEAETLAASVAEPTAEALLDEQAAALETPRAERATDAQEQHAEPQEQPTEEVAGTTFTPDEVLAETVEAAPQVADIEPTPITDPVNGTEARVKRPYRRAAAAPVEVVAPPPVAVAVQPPVVVAEAPPKPALVEEFVPPPMAQPSNVRWVKTTNGTRLPLRPAADD